MTPSRLKNLTTPIELEKYSPSQSILNKFFDLQCTTLVENGPEISNLSTSNFRIISKNVILSKSHLNNIYNIIKNLYTLSAPKNLA